jgi:predicted ATP-grasp superfamily ATP-dependent carboligase
MEDQGPMNLLLVEYLTAGALPIAARASLLPEGELMFRALAADLLALPSATVSCLYAADRPLSVRPDRIEGLAITQVPDPHAFLPTFARALRGVDAALLVAPEIGGVLENLTRMVEGTTVRLLGPSSASIRVAASKRATYLALDQAGVAVVPVYPLGEGLDPGDRCLNQAVLDSLPISPTGYVVKPDDGVGAAGVRFLPDLSTDSGRTVFLAWWAALPAAPVEASSWVVTPFYAGQALSLTLLTDGRQVRVLAVNVQRVERTATGEFIFSGVAVNAAAALHLDFAALAMAVVVALPGLYGFFGVDGILQGEEFFVVDINPRITTAYAGLARSLGVNPMALLLDLVQGGQAWRTVPLAAVEVEVGLAP